jgi:hypothetical protein
MRITCTQTIMKISLRGNKFGFDHMQTKHNKLYLETHLITPQTLYSLLQTIPDYLRESSFDSASSSFTFKKVAQRIHNIIYSHGINIVINPSPVNTIQLALTAYTTQIIKYIQYVRTTDYI